MALAVHVAGLTTVKVEFSSGGLQTLGYSRNGVDITYEGYHLDVHGDENGGDDGPPIEVQYMGEKANVRLELTKFDRAVADLCTSRLDGADPGEPGAAGTLMFGANKMFRLLLDSPDRVRNFPWAFVRGSIEENQGTKFTTLVMQIECHKDSTGVLFDDDDGA